MVIVSFTWDQASDFNFTQLASLVVAYSRLLVLGVWA